METKKPMKISEAIKQLEKLLKKEGDLDLELFDYEYDCSSPLLRFEIQKQVRYMGYPKGNKKKGLCVMLHSI